jgi:hypothetical protein
MAERLFFVVVAGVLLGLFLIAQQAMPQQASLMFVVFVVAVASAVKRGCGSDTEKGA